MLAVRLTDEDTEMRAGLGRESDGGDAAAADSLLIDTTFSKGEGWWLERY